MDPTFENLAFVKAMEEDLKAAESRAKARKEALEKFEVRNQKLNERASTLIAELKELDSPSSSEEVAKLMEQLEQDKATIAEKLSQKRRKDAPVEHYDPEDDKMMSGLGGEQVPLGEELQQQLAQDQSPKKKESQTRISEASSKGIQSQAEQLEKSEILGRRGQLQDAQRPVHKTNEALSKLEAEMAQVQVVDEEEMSDEEIL
ncbi:hypothetical protein BU16DRAFT_622243 [Lophium mytilinum]|uniref:Uncharacterized protein n=1 Tax=Lophium mytilinum TaxID=390894 RepID=A0A6A6QBE4_9PEZI|nr:hypothetical protein BU16DRAFT_622243 [Lophium mytilinum]